MKARVSEFPLQNLKNRKITNVILNEFNVEIVFEDKDTLMVEEYWEYTDEHNQLIDRALSSKFRKVFKLSEMIGSSVINIERVLETYHFLLNNNRFFRISSPDFEYSDLKQHKAFGDNSAWPGGGFPWVH